MAMTYTDDAVVNVTSLAHLKLDVGPFNQAPVNFYTRYNCCYAVKVHAVTGPQAYNRTSHYNVTSDFK